MYQYTFQVSILGVGPIWIRNNEKQKQELAQLLREGHVFAFGISTLPVRKPSSRTTFLPWTASTGAKAAS